jgi:hypothetical protein
VLEKTLEKTLVDYQLFKFLHLSFFKLLTVAE